MDLPVFAYILWCAKIEHLYVLGFLREEDRTFFHKHLLFNEDFYSEPFEEIYNDCLRFPSDGYS
jgi:hypothetical protein